MMNIFIRQAAKISTGHFISQIVPFMSTLILVDGVFREFYHSHIVLCDVPVFLFHTTFR